MTPAQFLARIGRKEIGPAYLFLGADAYRGRRAREALIAALLEPAERENGMTRFDLAQHSLAEVVDDARSLSLFASTRVVLVSNAEAALPRTRGEEEEEPGDSPAGSGDLLADYLRDPSPGVVLVFEATRYDCEGEDKKKLERVRRFYAAIAETIELRRASSDEARAEAQTLARHAGLSIDPGALDLLVEALAADLTRIACEIEKLSLYAGDRRAISIDDISALVPDARATTIFALVNAAGRRDRGRALEILDTLTREGEYLPLALAFLATQFRLAMVAREAGLRSPQQIQTHFSRLGVPMWSARAEQVFQTLSKFSREQASRALGLIYQADKGLRDARPDDRVVMEQFLFALMA